MSSNFHLTLVVQKENEIEALNVAASVAKHSGEIVQVKHGTRQICQILPDGNILLVKEKQDAQDSQ